MRRRIVQSGQRRPGRGAHQRAGQGAQAALRIPPARPVRTPGRAARCHTLPAVWTTSRSSWRCSRARMSTGRQLPDEHRLPAARLPVFRLVGQLRARQRMRQPAGVRRRLPDTKACHNQRGNFSAGFLPVTHQGTVISTAGATPIHDLRAPASARYITPDADRDGLALLQKPHLASTSPRIPPTHASKPASRPTNSPRGCSSARPRCSRSTARPRSRAASTESTTR